MAEKRGILGIDQTNPATDMDGNWQFYAIIHYL
mgnify:CR=1 FL=1